MSLMIQHYMSKLSFLNIMYISVVTDNHTHKNTLRRPVWTLLEGLYCRYKVGQDYLFCLSSGKEW